MINYCVKIYYTISVLKLNLIVVKENVCWSKSVQHI